MKKVLLTTVYRPFCVDDPFDAADNFVQHGVTHRNFTLEQGIYAIHQQSSHLGLHLIAANLDAHADVLEYPTLDEIGHMVSAEHYDFVGVTCGASTLRKARRICELVKEISPTSRTVVGGGGVMGIGDVIEPFADHVCGGDGVAFMRSLLGQDPKAPIRHPVVCSVHGPNAVMGGKANVRSYTLAVALGCTRRCEFCPTSAHFGGKRTQLLQTGDEIFDAMKAVEDHLRKGGERPSALYYIIFDENFLNDRDIIRRFHELNSRQLQDGTPYLPFIFADATNVKRYPVEQLLEMGIDAIWIGMESTSVKLKKNEGIDYPELVDELAQNGIKVFISFLIGAPEQTREMAERDVDFALELGAMGYQFAPTCPIPGTAYYERLKRNDQLNIEQLEHLNLGHYNLKHGEFSREEILDRIHGFHRADYERNGPMVLRYIKTRLQGIRRHENSPNPALRARAVGFRNDVMEATPMLSIGPVVAPNEEIRQEFLRLKRAVRKGFGRYKVLRDLLRGKTGFRAVLFHELFTNRALEPLLRQYILYRALRFDERSRGKCPNILSFFLNKRECIDRVRRGVMPWEQPVTMLRTYEFGKVTKDWQK